MDIHWPGVGHGQGVHSVTHWRDLGQVPPFGATRLGAVQPKTMWI